jgi:hypothetical protein
MNVVIGTEAAQFPKKEYVNGIFFAVYLRLSTLEECTKGNKAHEKKTHNKN